MYNQKLNDSSVKHNMDDKKVLISIPVDIDEIYEDDFYYEDAQIISDADLDDIMNEKPDFQ
jgi:hypothetical protein